MGCSDEGRRRLVVGVGFAGLSAARALGQAGKKVVVLEARDCVGGRTFTKTLDPQWTAWQRSGWTSADNGFRTDAAGDLRARARARHRHVPDVDGGREPRGHLGKTKRYRGTIPRLALLSLLNVGFAQWRLESMSKKVPLDAPWTAKKAAAWDARSLGDWLDGVMKTKAARDLLDAGLETVFAAGGHEISLLHALFYIHSGGDLDTLLGTEGGAQATRIAGGMQTVAIALAASLDVRLSCAVRRDRKRSRWRDRSS